MPTYPYKLNYYKVDIENFEVRELEETSTVLCIDFGTSNTALGAYLDTNYVRDLPTNDILNGNIKINEITFFDIKSYYFYFIKNINEKYFIKNISFYTNGEFDITGIVTKDIPEIRKINKESKQIENSF